jgi:hypothetical protein
MKNRTFYCAKVALLGMLFMLAGRAGAQGPCSVDFDNSDLYIQCSGPSEDTIEVYTEILAPDGELVRVLFVDIGDGEGPVDVGSASDIDLISIDTGNGNDEVFVHDVDTNLGLEVTTGAGNDRVIVGPEVGADELFFIGTSAGDDEIVLGLDVTVNTGTLEVRARDGSDTVITVAALPMEIGGIGAVGDIKIFGGNGDPEGPEEVDTLVIGAGSILSGGQTLLAEFERFGIPPGSE